MIHPHTMNIHGVFLFSDITKNVFILYISIDIFVKLRYNIKMKK